MNVSLWSADYEALVCMLLPFINGVVCEPWLSTNNGCLRGVEIGWAIRAATCFLIARIFGRDGNCENNKNDDGSTGKDEHRFHSFFGTLGASAKHRIVPKNVPIFPLLQVQRLNSMSEGQLSLDDHCSRSACHDGKTTNSWRSMLLKNPLLLSMVHYLVLLITHVVLFRYLQTYTIAYVRVSI